MLITVGTNHVLPISFLNFDVIKALMILLLFSIPVIFSIILRSKSSVWVNEERGKPGKPIRSLPFFDNAIIVGLPGFTLRPCTMILPNRLKTL